MPSDEQKSRFPYMDTQEMIRSQERRRLYTHAEAFLMSQRQPMLRFDLRELLAEFAMAVHDDMMNRLVYQRTVAWEERMTQLLKPIVFPADDSPLNTIQPTKPDSI